MARKSASFRQENDQLLMQALDETEDAQEAIVIRFGQYQQIAAQHYDKGVKPQKLQVGDYVLRKVIQNIQELNTNKIVKGRTKSKR